MQSLKQYIFTMMLFLVSTNIYAQNSSKNIILNEMEGRIYSFEQNQSYLDQANIISFIKDVSLNRDYRITNSEEALALIQSEYETSPKEIKKKCIKTLQCREYSLLEEGGPTMAAHLMWTALTYGKFKHPHLCSCIDWTEEYKNKVACHKCKDKRFLYCGQSFNCPACNGKGYTIEEEEGKKNLSLNEFLDIEYEIEKTDFFIYYNSPTDFGYLSGKNKTNVCEAFNKFADREIYDKYSIKSIAIKKPNKINKELSQFSELINEIETKIPDQILEASELWVENENILFPLNSSRQNILDRIEKGLINHFSQDTVNINVISSSSVDKNYSKSLNQGNHSIKGNLNVNGDYPLSDDFKKEIRQKSLIKGKAVDVYKPFRIDFIVEVRDSILIETNYYSSNTKKPVFLKGKQEFYYKTSSNLTALELKFDSAIPKGIIEVIEFYKYEKRLNDFIVAESKYKVAYKKAIKRSEKREMRKKRRKAKNSG